MQFTHLKIENWRNFRNVDMPLQRRGFLVGPNACGKSNLLDVFRFLRDLADPKGGFQKAVEDRGGVSQIRSLFARRYPNVAVEVQVDVGPNGPWSYRLELTQDNQRRPIVRRELVRTGDRVVLDRPDEDDKADPNRLSQTHLEQVNANKEFRVLAEFFARVHYLHIVPQLVREPDRWAGRARDPFGGDFLEQLASASPRTLHARLDGILRALRVAVPQLKEFNLWRDARGAAHLRGLYEHWRPNAGWQNERQLSDGTLRLLGMLWVLLDARGPLLLEEPELSLHAAVVQHVPAMMARASRKSGRQILVSTHSADLLRDGGIALEEVFLLQPSKEGTEVRMAAHDEQIRALLEGGLTMAEAVVPRTAPRNPEQLALFGD